MKKVGSSKGMDGLLDYNKSDLEKATDKPELIGDILTHWRKLASGKQTVVFATSIAHSKHIVETFNAAGVVAEHIDYHHGDDERAAILERFARGETMVLSNVSLLSEGWDCPACEVMILARPTRSLIRYIQMVGRVLRPAPGKTKALLLDHSGSTARLGHPCDDLPLFLDDGTPKAATKQQVERRESLPKPCPACSFMRPAGVHECPKCGFKPERQSDVLIADGELVKLERKKPIKKEAGQHVYSANSWDTRSTEASRRAGRITSTRNSSAASIRMDCVKLLPRRRRKFLDGSSRARSPLRSIAEAWMPCMRLNVRDVALGKWPGLLLGFGLTERQLSGKHGPCPVCGGHDRFRFDDKEGRGTWFCSHCGAGDGVALVMALKGWDFKTAARRSSRQPGVVQAGEIPKRQGEAEKIEKLRRVWSESMPLQAGDEAMRYLAGRGLSLATIPGLLAAASGPAVLRRPAVGRQIPGAGRPRGRTGRHRATLHRTYLQDGKKAPVPSPKKLMPGKPISGAAIRLAPAAEWLGIAEGIETALAASQLFDCPVWSGSVGQGIESFEPPPVRQDSDDLR